jgi:hypothetical protein
VAWFGFGKKKSKWANVYPMLYPSEFDTSYIEQSDTSPELLEGNRICSLSGPLGLRVYLLEQVDKNITRVVANRTLGKWQIGIEDLFDESISNLEEDILPNVEPVKLNDFDTTIAYLNGASSFTASLILSKKLWKRIGFDPKELTVAIPHRELFYFGISGSPNALNHLNRLVREIFEDKSIISKHLLSDSAAVFDSTSRFSWKSISEH